MILLYNSRKIVVFMPVGYRYRYPTIALLIAPTLIDNWFRYTTGVKVSYLRQLWTKSVIDYIGAIRKATVEHWYRFARVAFTYRMYVFDERFC